MWVRTLKDEYMMYILVKGKISLIKDIARHTIKAKQKCIWYFDKGKLIIQK